MKTLVGTKKGQRWDVVLTLCAVFVLPIYSYGPRVLIMLAIAVLTALVVDFCTQIIFKHRHGKRAHFAVDITSIITAMICTLLLSAATPYWVIVVTVAVALLIGKYPFGGRGHNIFNPAAVGLCFSGLCWPGYVFQYPEPFTKLGLGNYAGVELKASLIGQLESGGHPALSPMDVLLGRFAGPVGATAVLILMAATLYLLVRRTIMLGTPVTFLAVIGICFLLFPRITTSVQAAIGYEMISGVLLFGSVFLANDSSTTPKSRGGRIYFGIILGLLTILFQYYGINEYGFLYALLIANALSGFCDRLATQTASLFGRHDTRGEHLAEPQEERA